MQVSARGCACRAATRLDMFATYPTFSGRKLGQSSSGYKNPVREMRTARCGQSSFNTGKVRTAESFNVQLPGGRIDQLAAANLPGAHLRRRGGRSSRTHRTGHLRVHDQPQNRATEPDEHRRHRTGHPRFYDRVRFAAVSHRKTGTPSFCADEKSCSRRPRACSALDTTLDTQKRQDESARTLAGQLLAWERRSQRLTHRGMVLGGSRQHWTRMGATGR